MHFITGDGGLAGWPPFTIRKQTCEHIVRDVGDDPK
jgi:hypothetical protein